MTFQKTKFLWHYKSFNVGALSDKSWPKKVSGQNICRKKHGQVQIRPPGEPVTHYGYCRSSGRVYLPANLLICQLDLR